MYYDDVVYAWVRGLYFFMSVTQERLWSKDYFLLMASQMFTAFVNFFFFTAMPLFAVQLTGQTIMAGMMVTVYSLAALLARPIAGLIGDKFGRMRLMTLGAALYAVSCVLFALTHNITLLFAFRALNGFAFGLHSTCAGAAVADVLPPTRMAEGIGYAGLSTTIASASAPLISLAVVGDGQDISKFQLLFLLAGGLCAVTTLCNCLVSYERKRRRAGFSLKSGASVSENVVSEPDVPEARTVFGFETTLFLPIIMITVLFFALSSINSFMTIFATARGFDNIGLYFTFSSIGVVVARLFIGRIADRRGADLIVIPGMILMTLCFVLIPSVPSITFLVILAVPLGFSNSSVGPTLNSQLFKRCSPKRRGTVSAAYYAAIDIGFSLGALALGAVADLFGDYGSIYYTAAVMLVVALILYIFLVSDKQWNKRKNKKL